jgi:hypothetical protein
VILISDKTLAPKKINKAINILFLKLNLVFAISKIIKGRATITVMVIIGAVLERLVSRNDIKAAIIKVTIVILFVSVMIIIIARITYSIIAIIGSFNHHRNTVMMYIRAIKLLLVSDCFILSM